MSNPRVETLSAIFKSGYDTTRAEALKVPEDKRLHQIAEGKGHVLWHLGHIAQGNDVFINQWLLGGETMVPAEYHAQFAPGIMRGTTPTGNADDYPAWDDVLAQYDATVAKTLPVTLF